RVALADLGSKIFESGTGMKWTTTPAATPVPTKAVFGGKPVLGVGDLVSPEAKNSDGEWLNTPSRVIAAVGFDVMPYLIRAPRPDIRYTGPNDTAYKAAEAEVTELLRAFAKEHGSSARAIDVVSRNTPELQSVIATQLQAKLTELGGDLTVPSLLDGSIHERMADIAMLRLVLTTLPTGARLEETLGA